MRILITNTGPWGTGSGTVADGVMQELRQRGHEVIAFFPDAGFPGANYDKYYGQPDLYRIVPFPVTRNGVHLYTFPLIIPDPNPRNYRDAWTFKDLSEAELEAYFDYLRSELKQLLDDFRPDVIECQHIWAIDYILEELGYHYICVAHHSDQMGFLYDQRMQPLARRSAEKAAYIFAISDYVKQEVIDLYGVNPEKVLTMPNGYDQSVFRPCEVDRQAVLAEFGLTDPGFADLPIITFCGKISRTKGVDVLLKANHLIQRRQKALILLMGGGSLESFSLAERAAFCLENVVLLGHRSPQELAKLHNIATLSVLPSRSEGFGIAALEAMGCGLPLVATRTGGLADFAVGRLVEPEDEYGLAEAVLELLALPAEELEALGEKAWQTAQNYSWSAVVERRLHYYRAVAKLNRQRNFAATAAYLDFTSSEQVG